MTALGDFLLAPACPIEKVLPTRTRIHFKGDAMTYTAEPRGAPLGSAVLNIKGGVIV